jgi:hypothetical protein
LPPDTIAPKSQLQRFQRTSVEAHAESQIEVPTARPVGRGSTRIQAAGLQDHVAVDPLNVNTRRDYTDIQGNVHGFEFPGDHEPAA